MNTATTVIEMAGGDGKRSAGCLAEIHQWCGGAIYWASQHDNPYLTTTTPCECECHQNWGHHYTADSPTTT